MCMKLGKKIAWILLIVFIGMQFYRPEKNRPEDENHLTPFLTETNPPEEVLGIMKTSCFDCHTDQTRYPWYNNVAPVSWWLDGHIEEGREHLNFSEWASYTAKKKDHKLEEVIETESYRVFCPHNSSHWLGLDVHDVGDYRVDGAWRPLEPGMVLTVEPGIYIPDVAATSDLPEQFRGVGIRVEDDVLITAEGPEVLTREAPKEIDDIERVMAG